MGALKQLMPSQWKQNTTASGNELVLGWSTTSDAIRIANQNQIAVLGLELFKLTDSGLLTVSYTGYDLERSNFSDWKSYVEANNAEAEKWMKLHRYGADHGYMVTSASELEFAELKKFPRQSRKGLLKSLLQRLFR